MTCCCPECADLISRQKANEVALYERIGELEVALDNLATENADLKTVAVSMIRDKFKITPLEKMN